MYQHEDEGCSRHSHSGELSMCHDQSLSSPRPSNTMRPLPLLTLRLALALADSAGGPIMDSDLFAPNSVPMMGKKRQMATPAQKRGPKFYYLRSFMPMLRLKKEEEEMPFEYKTPWHLGKRLAASQYNKRAATASDIYTSAWIGSLFKPSSTDSLSKNRRMKYLRSSALKGKHFKASMNFIYILFVEYCILLNLTILFVKIL